MFQFPGFASPAYEFSWQYTLRCGFPHSDISGSKSARNSPELNAACYVLHRLSVPRHPPNALRRLISPNLARRGQPAIPREAQEHTQHFFSSDPGDNARQSLIDSHRQRPRPGRHTTYPQCQTATDRAQRAGPSSDLLKRTTGNPTTGRLVELNGIEPMTSCLQSRRSPN